ncbi:MAG: hypothetical protein ACRDT8_26735, partial [Micromonosporaceae bacterium]
ETDSAGTRYSPRLVAQLSGLVAQEVVQRWWSAAGVQLPAPEDVVGWRPEISDDGAATLREHLRRRELPAGMSLERGARGRLAPETLAWLRQWVLGLRGQTSPSTGEFYSLAEVLDTAGGLIARNTLIRWWRSSDEGERQQPGPPEDVAAWRPDGSPQGPGTLREYLEQRGLPAGESFDTVAPTRLRPVVREWVLQWVLGLSGDVDPGTGQEYTPEQVVRLSGGLVHRATVGAWWRWATGDQPPLPAPPADVLRWRPDGSEDGPATLRDYLARRKLPAGVSLVRDVKGHLSPETWDWVRRWAEGLYGQTNREGKLYASRDAVELSGGLVDQTVVSKWWRTGRQPSTTA